MKREQLEQQFHQLSADPKINNDETLLSLDFQKVKAKLGSVFKIEKSEIFNRELAEFLASRWKEIAGGLLCYTRKPNTPVNHFCLNIARYLHAQDPGKQIRQHLMLKLLN